MTDGAMRLIVHPGIGDLSWLISKLSTTGEQYDLVIAEDSKTKRAMPLADMVPCIRSAEYGGHDAYAVLTQCTNARWAEYKQAHAEGKDLYITANWWLDAGNRLEGFLPDLDTDFHYPLVLGEQDHRWAEDLLSGGEKAFGIYTSSAAGVKAWSAWSVNEWLDFMERVHAEYPNVRFYLLGAKWDMDIRLSLLDALSRKALPHVDLFGRTTLQQAMALIQRLDYFAGFASGLTIMADVLDQPVCMLYPGHLIKLMSAWPDPRNLASGKHQAHVWKRPVDVFDAIRPYLEEYLG